MIRTLVTDDDFMVASVHREYTERMAGFEVVGEAHSGREALRLAAGLHPDLVLLDLYLPDMGGLEVAEGLHVLDARPDVIVITAARDASMVEAAMRGGVLHYIVKPFTFPTFREKLEGYAAWRAELARLGPAGQRDVDRLYALLRPSDSRSLPKGLSVTTLDLVESVLQGTGQGTGRGTGEDLSAAEVARAAGISRVTARRYLEHLTETGRVTLRLRYGSAGRPEHRYSPAAGG